MSITPKLYEQHIKTLYDTISNAVINRRMAYYPKENDSLTEVIIDTILYSPHKDKLAFLVITKNSNDKLLGGGNKNEFHFDAHCFLGLISNWNVNDISWLEVYNLSNYTDLKWTSERIREVYIKELGGGVLKYNLDDIRFWDNSYWLQIYDKPSPLGKFESP